MLVSIGSAEHMHGDLHTAVDEAIERGNDSRALALLDQLLREMPTIANAQFVDYRLRAVPAAKPRVSIRLAILRSFTFEPVLPLLKAAALIHGLQLEIWLGGFNTYAQEMLDPESDLYKFEPDAVLLAVQARDVVPELWDCDKELDRTAAAASVERVLLGIREWIGTFRSHSKGHLVVQDFELPDAPSSGILDAQSSHGQTHNLQEINRRLRELSAEWYGVHVLNYDGLTARFGKRRWHDERKWLTARMPVAADCLMPLAQEYLRFLLPLAGVSAKVLVVDLDNTLWGGVLAEDGVQSLQVGTEYPGALYANLQRAILAVRRRGVLLAIASKNNESDALEALERHPGMLLRGRDFAAHRINWNDKAQSLREIATELNVGLDSLAFLDDSPIERDRIRLALPEVAVIELSADPTLWARSLRDCPLFERLSLSAEDRERDHLYSAQRQRTDLERRTASLDDFLRSLEMQMEMRELSPEAVTRVAQLTQKTNQFNLTTRRYSEQEIAGLAADASARVYQVRVRDRFGDNGIVGVAITRDLGGAWEIDTLLLSCRVIGRTIEKAILARIADDAATAGVNRLRGWFLATKKNQPSSSFYSDNSFSRVEWGDGASLWELDLRASRPVRPDWINVPELVR
jgi:FkbH-like protein